MIAVATMRPTRPQEDLPYLIGAGLAAIAVAIAVFVLREAEMPAAAAGEVGEGRQAPAYSDAG